MEQAGLALAEVDAIASHGQTVGHLPELRATLQIGDPSLIAERTGCTTVADFRPRDVAAGGEGAPLAPFFHYAALADPAEGRLVLNLGGIANVTWLPAGCRPEEVVAFDVGPANALLDGVGGRRDRRDASGWIATARARAAAASTRRSSRGCSTTTSCAAARRRARAASATAAPRPRRWWPPRARRDAPSTTCSRRSSRSPPRRSARAWREHLAPGGGRLERVLVGGGGARNPALRAALAAALPGVAVEPMDAAGVPADAAEAMAFSLLGRNALLGAPEPPAALHGRRRGARCSARSPSAAPVRA